MYVSIERNISCDTGSPTEKRPSAETTCVGKRRMQNGARTQGHVKQSSQARTETQCIWTHASQGHIPGKEEGGRV